MTSLHTITQLHTPDQNRMRHVAPCEPNKIITTVLTVISRIDLTRNKIHTLGLMRNYTLRRCLQQILL